VLSWHCQCKNGLRKASPPQHLPFPPPAGCSYVLTPHNASLNDPEAVSGLQQLGGRAQQWLAWKLKVGRSTWRIHAQFLFYSFIGLARTIYTRCVYIIFGREITKYTVYTHSSGLPYSYTIVAKRKTYFEPNWSQTVKLRSKSCFTVAPSWSGTIILADRNLLCCTG